MAQYALKVKGRGFLAGLKHTSRYKNYTDEEAEANKVTNPNGYVWTPSGTWISYLNIYFKRNLSDVDTAYIKGSHEECMEVVECLKDNLKKDSKTDYRTHGGIDNLEVLDKVEVVSLDEGMIEKRVLNSKKKTFYTQDLLHLNKKSNGSKPVYCNHCGTNIYKDEPFLKSTTATVCIHCLSGLAKDISEAYEKLPEKNKTDYLLARAVDI